MRPTSSQPPQAPPAAATLVAAVFVWIATACASATPSAGSSASTTDAPPAASPAVVVASEPGERHLHNIRQLTFGGENAEAYFSRDGRRLIYQARPGGQTCDQQYVMNVDGSNVRRVSTGFGKTTCGYFYDGD